MKSLIRWVALLLLAGSLSMALAESAAAHADVVSTTPASNARVDSAPSEAVVEFDSRLMSMGAAMVVRDDNARTISQGLPVIDGRRISIALDGDAGSGRYTVAFRAVSEDGHTITSSYTYVVNGAVPTAVPSGQPGIPTATGAGVTPATSAGGVSPIVWIVALLLMVFVSGLVLLVRYRSGGRHRNSPEGDLGSRLMEDPE